MVDADNIMVYVIYVDVADDAFFDINWKVLMLYRWYRVSRRREYKKRSQESSWPL